MKRTDIINALINKYGYKRYLEVGVHNGKNFGLIKAPFKECVDPAPEFKHCTYKMTSDKFFGSLPDSTIYDIIFIDGLHLAKQVNRDIANSLQHLSPKGSIVLHDCNPKHRKHQSPKVPIDGRTWNGTVWKAFAQFRMSRKDLSMYVVSCDHGCGVIQRGSQRLFPDTETANLTWAFLEANRNELLNLITVEDFLTLMEK